MSTLSAEFLSTVVCICAFAFAVGVSRAQAEIKRLRDQVRDLEKLDARHRRKAMGADPEPPASRGGLDEATGPRKTDRRSQACDEGTAGEEYSPGVALSEPPKDVMK